MSREEEYKKALDEILEVTEGCLKGTIINVRKIARKAVESKEWQPEGGNWIIYGDGLINREGNYNRSHSNEGRVYPTEIEAKTAYSLIRPYQRFVAWLIENVGVDEFKTQPKGSFDTGIIWNWTREIYVVSVQCSVSSIGKIFLKKEKAEELCNQLNAGKVVF